MILCNKLKIELERLHQTFEHLNTVLRSCVTSFDVSVCQFGIRKTGGPHHFERVIRSILLGPFGAQATASSHAALLPSSRDTQSTTNADSGAIDLVIELS